MLADASQMDFSDLHPIAREVLAAFSERDYFRSNKLCRTVAETCPQRCVDWAFRTASPTILSVPPPSIVSDTISLVERALICDEAALLPELDAAATASWSSGSYSEDSPYLQRAAARLAWATMCRISHATGADFDTQFAGVANGARNDAFTEMVNQSAMAIDMTNCSSNDTRLSIALAFTKEMDSLS